MAEFPDDLLSHGGGSSGRNKLAPLSPDSLSLGKRVGVPLFGQAAVDDSSPLLPARSVSPMLACEPWSVRLGIRPVLGWRPDLLVAGIALARLFWDSGERVLQCGRGTFGGRLCPPFSNHPQQPPDLSSSKRTRRI